MPWTQDQIHKLEVGGGLRYFRLGIAALGIVVVILGYNWRGFRNMSNLEAMDSAQLGRNLAEGKGYSTLFVRPFSMYLLKKHNLAKHTHADDLTQIKGNHPDTSNPPAYPTVLAGLMKVLPFQFTIPEKPKAFWSSDGRFARYQPDFLISVFNEVLFFAIIVLTYFLARRLFDASVARLAAVLLLGTELLWRFSVSGLSTNLLMLIFTCLVWCLVLIEQEAREPRRGTGWLLLLAVFAGALVGLGGLTRYSFAWLIIPVLGFLLVFCGSQRVVAALVALVFFVGVMAPWLVRNYRVSGTLLGTPGYCLVEGTLFAEHQLERSLDPALGAFSMSRIVPIKLMANVPKIVQNELPKFGGNWVSAFFLVGLLVGFRHPASTRLRYFLVFCFVLLVLAQALGRTQLSEDVPEVNSENLLVILVPLAFVYGISLFYALLDTMDLPFRQLRYLAITLFTAVACLPMIFVLIPFATMIFTFRLPGSNPIAYPPYYPPAIQTSVSWTKEKEMMMSDIPWAVAWYGQTQTMWLTLGPQMFLDINDYQKPIQELYITRATLDETLLGQLTRAAMGDPNWSQVLLQNQEIMIQNSAKINKAFLEGQERLSLKTAFPLHYLQVIKAAGLTEQILLTSREHPPKEE